MNIKATALHDWNFHKALVMSQLYGTKLPRTVRAIIAAVTAVILLACVCLAFYGLKVNDSGCIVMAVVLALLSLFTACVFSVCPFPAKMLYKSRFKEWTPEYYFEFGDESVKMSAILINNANERTDSGNMTLDYSQLKKAFECSEYIFITLTDGQNFGFSKANIENGTAEDIRNKLQAVLGRKYKIAKY